MLIVLSAFVMIANSPLESKDLRSNHRILARYLPLEVTYGLKLSVQLSEKITFMICGLNISKPREDETFT